MDLYTTLDQSSRAVDVGLDYLRHLGIDWSPHPTDEEARREYERIWSQLGSRTIEDLIDLPLMSDPASLATLDVLTKLAAGCIHAYGSESVLPWSSAARSISASSTATATVRASPMSGLASSPGPHFGDYQAGFRFGRLGYELVEKRGLKRFQARDLPGVRTCRHALDAACPGRP